MKSQSVIQNSKNIDWELVNDFKQGLEELKRGEVQEYKKGSLLE